MERGENGEEVLVNKNIMSPLWSWKDTLKGRVCDWVTENPFEQKKTLMDTHAPNLEWTELLKPWAAVDQIKHTSLTSKQCELFPIADDTSNSFSTQQFSHV